MQLNRLNSLNQYNNPSTTNINSTPTNLFKNEKKDSNPYASLKNSQIYNVDSINKNVQSGQSCQNVQVGLSSQNVNYSNYTNSYKKSLYDNENIFDSATVTNFNLYNNSKSTKNSQNLTNSFNHNNMNNSNNNNSNNNSNNNNSNNNTNTVKISKPKASLFSKASKNSIKDTITVNQSNQNSQGNQINQDYQNSFNAKFKKLSLKADTSHDFKFCSIEDEIENNNDYDSDNHNTNDDNKKIQSELIKSKVVLNNTQDKQDKSNISKSSKHKFNPNSLNKMYISTNSKNVNERIITMTKSSKYLNVKLSNSKNDSNVKLPLIDNVTVNDKKFAKLNVNLNNYENVNVKQQYKYEI